MITKDERGTLLAISAPLGVAVLLILPFIQGRVAQAVADIALALAFTIVGMAIAAPVQENGDKE